jgi:ribonuclease HI
VKRLQGFFPVIRHFSLSRKILVFNVYILSLFSFLGRYFVIPESICALFRQLVISHLIPWQKAYSYIMLLSGTHQVGLRLPLRDLWAANVSLLANRFRFPLMLTAGDLPTHPKLPHSYKPISHSIEAAALEFALHWSNWAPNGKPYKLPHKTYKAVLAAGYGEDFGDNHLRKLKRFNELATTSDATRLREVWASTQGKLRGHIYETAFRGVTNSLPTEHRRTCHGTFVIPSRVPGPNPWPCAFCQVGPNTIEHFYSSHCPTTKAATLDAWARFFPLVTPPTAWDAPLFLLLMSKPSTPAVSGMLLCLCWAIWEANSRCLSGTHPDNARKTIGSLLLSQAATFTGLRVPDPNGPKTKKLARKVKAEALIHVIPHGSVTCFSDGSSLGNPGPAGAGAHVAIPGQPPVRLFAPIGHGTNNQGEMSAFLIIFRYLEDQRVPHTHEVYVVTDSKLSQDQLLHNAKVKKNHQLVRDTREAARPRKGHLHIILAPSHVDIPLNEVADKMAKHAADRSAKGALPAYPLAYSILHGCLSPPAKFFPRY